MTRHDLHSFQIHGQIDLNLFQTDGRTAEHPHPSCYTYDVFDGPMHFCQSARAVILYVYQSDNGGKIIF